MKNNRNIKILNESGSITHIGLLSALGILSLVLAFNVVTKQSHSLTAVLGDESSDAYESSTNSEVQEDEGSGEVSEDDKEASTASTYSVDNEESAEEEVSNEELSVQEISTVSEVSTYSEISTEDETESVEEEDEASVSSEVSTTSSGFSSSFSDFETVVELSDNVAVVSNQERLFFLIPVDIEYTLELDESGEVISVQQSLLSKILSWLSF